MKQNIRLLLPVFITIFCSCEKEGIPNLALPEITQTGQNTLGFMLGNKVWANYGRRCTTLGGCGDNKVTATMSRQSNGLFRIGISANYTADTLDQSFNISTADIINTGTYIIDSNLNRSIRFLPNGYNQYFQEYSNRLQNKCFLTISRFDTLNKIISGIFNATLYDRFNLNDSVIITDGRFDAQLN